MKKYIILTLLASLIIFVIVNREETKSKEYIYWEKYENKQCEDDLYFILSGEYIKIGRSNNVSKRLKQLSTGNPNNLTLLLKIENKGCLEKYIHKAFKKYKHNKEWYNDNARIRKFIKYLKNGKTN